ncbi:hypothetical protein [Nostoc sp.]
MALLTSGGSEISTERDLEFCKALLVQHGGNKPPLTLDDSLTLR